MRQTVGYKKPNQNTRQINVFDEGVLSEFVELEDIFNQKVYWGASSCGAFSTLENYMHFNRFPWHSTNLWVPEC